MDIFMELLPLLRRTFAVFSDPERRKMMELAKFGPVEVRKEKVNEDQLDEGRAELVMGTVRELLG